MQVKISAVIITLNEERNIARCLQSLQGVADEILVVDSFSTDRTEEICKSFGARFMQHPFKGYASQKNFALQAAVHDVVLSLDADEALSDALKKSILEVKSDLKADAYFFNRLTNYCGKWIRHCGWYPDRKTRLLNRRKGMWGGGEVHERVMMNEDAVTAFLKGDLLHYSYYSAKEHISQQQHFAEMAAREMLQKGKQVSRLYPMVNAAFTFFRKYFLQAGFLDGRRGYAISMISAKGNYWKYSQLRALHRHAALAGGSGS